MHTLVTSESWVFHAAGVMPFRKSMTTTWPLDSPLAPHIPSVEAQTDLIANECRIGFLKSAHCSNGHLKMQTVILTHARTGRIFLYTVPGFKVASLCLQQDYVTLQKSLRNSGLRLEQLSGSRLIPDFFSNLLRVT